MAIKFLILIIIFVLLIISIRSQSNFTTSVSSEILNIDSLEEKAEEINEQIKDFTNKRNEFQQILGTMYQQVIGSPTTSSSA